MKTISAKPLRAVIVEDEPLGRALLRQMLIREPDVNLVAECAGGNEAIDGECISRGKIGNRMRRKP